MKTLALLRNLFKSKSNPSFMSPFNRFTFLMKGEPPKNKNVWMIDETKCLSRAEVEVLRATAKQMKQAGLREHRYTLIRNWFMIELGLNAGFRVTEMASLKHGNLILDNDRSSITVVGKGNKKRSVWVNSSFKDMCFEFINIKLKFEYSIDDTAPLLNNLVGEHISKRSLQKFFKEILAEAAISTHYGIHSLRHTYATFLLKSSGNNYRFVQKQLGHSSLRTTQVYAGVLESEGRKAVENIYK